MRPEGALQVETDQLVRRLRPIEVVREELVQLGPLRLRGRAVDRLLNEDVPKPIPICRCADEPAPCERPQMPFDCRDPLRLEECREVCELEVPTDDRGAREHGPL